ncbi:FAD-binding oxidoreductase [Mycolicibacterium sp.]|uniref:FAD-binding oxidoreductase n=1 Tax=Mycolicibacterium sp. TaxID=2320850 RepID=UPI001DF4C15D|nr:FAD-dependent oxidoreductase [Mycolicibacterium sp.]MCB1291233.1 FAD-dependent oxidoreductase [Mycobacterium sp.]MCB9409415.1 FAD-dependent oxidoreductase [Mycolicibacterium sp.]
MHNLSRRGFLGAAGLAVAGLAASCARREPSVTGITQAEWADLRGVLRGSVVRPGDADYPELATPRNLRYAAVMPEAVVLCSGAQDIAAALNWARATNTPFAIRGGGHNYSDASSSRGIVISTRRMNAATIQGNRLTAEAGARNADLAVLLPQGGRGTMLLPGGNCPGVGLAGLTLGGGIGPNAPWAGLTADRLRKATMVTAEGTMVTASATENPDLFWGLRGGAGGNFGVVTDLEYELVEIPARRVTTAELNCRGRDAALAMALGFQQLRDEAERTATGNLYLGHSEGDVEATLTAQVLGPESTARELLAPMLRITGVTADVTERPWWDAYSWYVTDTTPQYSFWDRSLYADEFLSGDTLAEALEVVARFPARGPADDRNGAIGLYGWVGGAVSDVADDDTAYVHRRARLLVEMSSWWPTAAEPSLPVSPIPPEIQTWAQQLWQVLLPHTTGQSYQNFPDPELREWASAYYGDNLIRLEGLKAAWDPEDVFSYSQGIPLPR